MQRSSDNQPTVPFLLPNIGTSSDGQAEAPSAKPLKPLNPPREQINGDPVTETTLDGQDTVPCLDAHMKNGGTLVVVAGCGSQKSYQSRLWMAKVLRADDRILAISCRVIHACDCFRELESLGFVVYTDTQFKSGEGRARLLQEKRIIISLGGSGSVGARRRP